MKENKEKYLVACSGGPDSMALLDMFKDKYELYVCHINYHKRESAKRDELIVRRYCKKNKIKCFVYDYIDSDGGNFQDKARVFRYERFKKCIEENNLKAVLVGHHKDDLIETYFLQLQRKSNVTYWGLNKKTKIMDVDIVRPLLKYTKNDLLNYCIKNNIEYGIDESNLEDHYLRNKIRHTRIEKMSLKEKNEIIKEINNKNKIEKLENQKVKKFIKKRDHFNYEEFMNYSNLKKLIRALTYADLSNSYLDEIIKALRSKNNQELKVKNKLIFKEYGYIEVKDKPSKYSYTFKALEYCTFDNFKLSKKGTSFEGVTVSSKDFPLTLRNYEEGDYIKMCYGTKKLNRFFIDNKISSYKRKIWPVLFNREGSAILVPGIGCDLKHYSQKHNLYIVIK